MADYKCEVCDRELSDIYVRHYFDMLDYHALCVTHRDMYLEVKNSVTITWNGTKFVATLPENK